MRFLLCVVFLIMIICSGCGPSSYWYNENKTYQRADSDCWDCLYQAQREIIEAADEQRKEFEMNSVNSEPYKHTVFEKCMKDKGYKIIQDYNLDYTIRKGFVVYNDDYYYIAGK